MAIDQSYPMKKWIYLFSLTAILLVGNYLYQEPLNLHPSFGIMVIFLSILTFSYFRLDNWLPKAWQVQIALIKIVLRFLLSSGFIVVLIYTQDDDMNMVIQFISLYLIFMVFEIAVSLTNLRRN